MKSSFAEAILEQNSKDAGATMIIANYFLLENTLFIHTNPFPNQVNVTVRYKSIETTVISLGKKPKSSLTKNNQHIALEKQ